MGSPPERDAGFLHFLIGEQPDKRLVAQIADLNAIAPGIAKVAAKTRMQLQLVLLRELLSHFLDLLASRTIKPKCFTRSGCSCRPRKSP